MTADNAPAPAPVTLLVAGGDVVTMNPAREVLVGGAVAVAEDVIAAVGSSTELARRYRDAEVLDATGCVVTPGMVNAHQHLTGDPLIRSCIPDLVAPGTSIFEWSVPAHGAHTGDDDELSALLSSVENLTNGVTTVVEAGTVANPYRAAAGMRQAGIRGTMGTWGWDIEEGPFTAPAHDVLDRQREVVDTLGSGGLVEGWVTLVGHDLASDELLAGAADLARALGTGLTMHMSPTSSDPERYLARAGRRPLVHLDALGVLGPHLLVGHGVWLDDSEVELVLSTSTAVAYCPWAYLRLGQGVAGRGRHAEIVERGGRVALGCDASNAGDTADILRTAALAAGLARDTRVDPERFGAHTAFELASIAGRPPSAWTTGSGASSRASRRTWWCTTRHRSAGLLGGRRCSIWCGALTGVRCVMWWWPAGKSSGTAPAPRSTWPRFVPRPPPLSSRCWRGPVWRSPMAGPTSRASSVFEFLGLPTESGASCR